MAIPQPTPLCDWFATSLLQKCNETCDADHIDSPGTSLRFLPGRETLLMPDGTGVSFDQASRATWETWGERSYVWDARTAHGWPCPGTGVCLFQERGHEPAALPLGWRLTGSWRRPAHALRRHRALAAADDCLLAERVGDFLRGQSTSSRSAAAGSPEAECFLFQFEESDKLTRGGISDDRHS